MFQVFPHPMGSVLMETASVAWPHVEGGEERTFILISVAHFKESERERWRERERGLGGGDADKFHAMNSFAFAIVCNFAMRH